METFKIVWGFYRSFFKGFRRLLVASVSMSLLHAFLLIPASLLIKRIFDQAIPDNDIVYILQITGGIFMLLLTSSIVIIFEKKITLQIIKNLIEKVREALFNRILYISHQKFESLNKVSLHSTLVYHTQRLDVLTNAIISTFVPSLLIITFLSTLLFYLDWKLALIVFIFIPLPLFGSQLLGKKVKTNAREFNSIFDKFSRSVLFFLNYNPLIKIRSAEIQQQQLHKSLFRSLNDAGYKMAFHRVVNKTLNEFTIVFSSLLVLAYGSYSVISQSLSLGSMLSFYFTLYLMRKHQINLFSSYGEIVSSVPSIERVNELIANSESEIEQTKEKVCFDKKIHFMDVSFGYSSNLLLSGVNLTVTKGEITVILGSNGSGKTTLILLLLGLVKPKGGSIVVDGLHKYDNIDLSYFRSKIGAVMQDNSIFEGTIRENIVFGKSTPTTDEEITSAILITGGEDILSLPNSLDTKIGSDGVLISGGQAQKIAIARALINSPTLLVLDEPTNHLDLKSISILLNNLQRVKAELAVLIISHNESVAQYADTLLKLEDKTLRLA